MRCHHRQVHACCQLHRLYHQTLIIWPPCTLQLQIKAVGECAGQLQGRICCPLAIATQQQLPYRAGIGTRQQQQAFTQLTQPFPFEQGLCLPLGHIASPPTRQNFGQIQKALMTLHQQQYAACDVSAPGFHIQLSP